MESTSSKEYVEISLGEMSPRKATGIGSLSAAQKFLTTMTSRLSSSKDGFKTAGQLIKTKRKQWCARTGLKGLRFINKAGNGQEGWKGVEKRFDDLAVNGLLRKESFSKCIGMNDSKDFASELFLALARRQNINPEKGVTKEELKLFWDEITDQNFDSRLRIFFDMYLFHLILERKMEKV